MNEDDGVSLATLAAALHGRLEEVRHAAIHALGESGDGRALTILLDYFRNLPGFSLAELSDIQQAVLKFGADAVDPLIPIFLSPSPWIVAHWAAEALGRLGGRGVDFLIESLRNPDSKVRAKAAGGLGYSSEIRAADSLIETLRADSDYKVREAAASSLGKLGVPRGREALQHALEHDDPLVKQSAAKALGTWIEPREGNYYLIEAADKERKRHLALIKVIPYPGGLPGKSFSYASNFGCYLTLAGKVPLIDVYSPFIYETDDYLHMLEYHVFMEIREEDVGATEKLLENHWAAYPSPMHGA